MQKQKNKTSDGISTNTTSADALVVFQPSGRRGHFAIGTPVLEAARSLGVYVESVCGGRGICGRCQIIPIEGEFAKYNIKSNKTHLSPVNKVEQRYADKRSLASDRRLSCQAKILNDIVIEVPTEAQTNRQLVRKRAETRRIPRNPATTLRYVEIGEPDINKPLGDADRLIEALRQTFDLGPIDIDIAILPTIQTILRQDAFKVTTAIHDDGKIIRLLGLWPGYRETLYGIACDIGSTTIAVHLVDLMSGRTVASAGSANPQIRYGEDLMSRVSYILMNPDGQTALTEAVRGAINALIAKVIMDAKITQNDIAEAVFVGNPVMHHLFLNIDPKELGGAPFALAISGSLDLPARALDLNMNAGGRAYILPCIAGHVGADAAAATLAEGPHRTDKITLLVDIGTNAEIILGNRERVLAASSPTGPAFEGAEISCGQRAAPGAIERVRIDPETLESKIKVIGVDVWSDDPQFHEAIEQVGVTGICGSGIIEVIGEMRLANLITQDGVIDGNYAKKSDRVIAEGRTSSYHLWRGSPEIVITQNDVRAIQLAKAALYAGIRLLMDRSGIDHVEHIRLAGAFGSYIDPKYAMILGLIPDCELSHVKAVGNAAGTGARMALLNTEYRREIEALVERIEKIETATEKRFQEHFVNAMAIPNKVDLFPILSNIVSMPAPPPDTDTSDGRPRRRGGRRGNRPMG